MAILELREKAKIKVFENKWWTEKGECDNDDEVESSSVSYNAGTHPCQGHPKARGTQGPGEPIRDTSRPGAPKGQGHPRARGTKGQGHPRARGTKGPAYVIVSRNIVLL